MGSRNSNLIVLLLFNVNFRYMYLCLHILALLALFIVPRVIPKVPRRDGIANGHSRKYEPPNVKTAISANGVCKNHHD